MFLGFFDPQRSADEPGSVAQLRSFYLEAARGRNERSPAQFFLSRQQEQGTPFRHAAADDNDFGIECIDKRSQPDA